MNIKFAIINNICYNIFCLIKRSVNFILKVKLFYYTKKSFKFIIFLIIALIVIASILFLKYKPAYKVTFLGEMTGYVQNKNSFEKLIDEKILNSTESNVAFVTLNSLPSFELKFIDKTIATNEDEIFSKIKENSEATYEMYAITLNGENKTYVSTLSEAEEVVKNLKEENNADNELDLGISKVYTTNLEELNTVLVADAKNEISGSLKQNIIQSQKQEEKQIEQQNVQSNVQKGANVFDGVYFTVKPVSGTITSRFGSKERIRSSAHKGIDIGAPNGTPIKAAASGTVTCASYTTGGYGNLVVISHGNNIETYYGHASKIYVKKGQKVSAGDVIAAVGSTGRSTGNHLHFEIRKNGNQINPQIYVYK